MRGDVDETDGSHKVHIYKFSFVQAPTVAKFTVVVAVVMVGVAAVAVVIFYSNC